MIYNTENNCLFLLNSIWHYEDFVRYFINSAPLKSNYEFSTEKSFKGVRKWPRGLRRGPCVAFSLGSWVRIPLKPCFFFCVHVKVEALRRADPSSKESYRMSIDQANEKLGPAVLRQLKNGSFPVSQKSFKEEFNFRSLLNYIEPSEVLCFLKITNTFCSSYRLIVHGFHRFNNLF
jgi:hypothetical protein